MNNDILISIIIPMYNAENFIINTVNSIICQEFNKFEIIIVDDGSTDNSYKLCKEKFENDNRIKLYRKNNGGVSSARNFGINHAVGKYVQFVDSDDLIESNYSRELLNNLLRESADLAICSFTQAYGDVEKNFLIKNGVYTKEEFIKLFSSSDNSIFMNPPWNKLYNLDIIKGNNIRFDEDVSFGEDFIFNANYLLYCNKIVTLDSPLYIYLYQENGLCNKKRTIKFYIENNLKMFYFYEKLLNQVDDLTTNKNLNNHFLFVVRNIISSIFITNKDMSFKEKTIIVKDLINNDDIRSRLNPNYKKNLKNVITYLCIKYNLFYLLSFLMFIIK